MSDSSASTTLVLAPRRKLSAELHALNVRFGHESVQVGEMLQVDTGDGWGVVTVKEVSATHITIDGNHELAGEDLFFEIEIISLRQASEEEVAHGHAHGPDGHHHHD